MLTTPLLAEQEEFELAKRFRATGDRDALGRLVTSYLRLVVKMANGYRRRGVPFEDLVSEGCLGLLEAAKRFDPDKGFRFSTYARWWIKSQILGYVGRTRSIVRPGAGGRPADAGLGLDVHADGGTAPIDLPGRDSEAALGDFAAASAHAPRGIDVSLNRLTGDASLTELQDLLVDPAESVETELAERQEFACNRRLLSEAIYRLNDRERHIFTARYLWDKPLTLEELAGRFNISRERVRQIETAAWRKVRRAVQAGASLRAIDRAPLGKRAVPAAALGVAH
jgi:RNA polymerase sigma-32 factor